MFRFLALCAAAAALVACASPTAPPPSASAPGTQAVRRVLAMDGMTALLKIEGVHGTSTLDRYQGYTPVRMLELGLANAESGVTLKPFTFAKAFDAASPSLLSAVANGQTIKSARLVLLTGGAQSTEFAAFKLSGITVTRYDLQGKDGGSLEEGFSMTAARVEMIVTPQSATGRSGAPITAIFNAPNSRTN